MEGNRVNETIEKESTKSTPKNGSKKSIKVLIIALASAIGLAGAGTGIYFVVKNSQPSPQQQPVIDEEVVKVIDAMGSLSVESSGEEIYATYDAFNSLSKEQQEEVPSELIVKINNSKDKYDANKEVVVEFENAAKPLEDIEGLKRPWIDGVKEKYKNEIASKDIKNSDLVERIKNAKEILDIADGAFTTAELAIKPLRDAFNNLEQNHQTFSKEELTTAEKICNETQGSRIAEMESEITAKREKLMQFRRNYELDEETANAFIDAVNAIKSPDDEEEITKAKGLENDALRIKRTDLVDPIKKASQKLDKYR